MQTATRQSSDSWTGTAALARRARRTALTLAVLVLVTGCAGDSPTAPVTSPTIVRLTNAASFADMIADVQGRVIPSLPDDAKRVALASSFDVLQVSLQKADARPVKVALDAASAAIETYASNLGANRGFDADLDVLRLSMQVIGAQLMVDMLTGN